MRKPGSDVKLHIQNWYKKPGHDIMIADNGLMCYRIVDGDVWTGPAWVHPDFRRQGIMTEIVLRILKKHGDKRFLLSITNPDLDGVTKMYLKMGRKPTKIDEGLFWKDHIPELLRRNNE